jgi:hypothetical protein
LFFRLTQHSAFGYVLGYDMSRLRRLIFMGHTPPTKDETGVLTQTLKRWAMIFRACGARVMGVLAANPEMKFA